MFPLYNAFRDGQEQPMTGRVLPRAASVMSGNSGLTQNVAQGAALGGYDEELTRLGKEREAAQARLREMRDRPVDYTQLQELAKQRGMEGEDAMLTALAAQFAGPQYQGLQGALLKRSMSAREPIKTARGMVTAEGFVGDPDALQADEVRRAGEDAQFAEQQYGRVLTVAERAAAARQAAQDRKDEARVRAEERERERGERREDRAADRVSRAANAALVAGATGTNRLATLEDRLADDYRNDTKEPRKIVGIFDNLKSTPATAAGDISFIFQYMKLLDPTSVVRESEFATAQNAGGVPDTVRNLYNRARSGQRLNPQQREQFLATAASLASNAERSLQGAQRHYGEIAQRRGLDPRNIFDRGGPGSGSVRVDY
jgi:hypothetical protein